MTSGSRFRWLLDHAEEVLAGTLVIGLTGLAFVNVLARYLVNYALAFSEELEVAGLVWLTMLGAAAGFRRGAHLGFSFLRDRLPGPARKGVAALGVGVTVGVGGVLLWGGLAQIQAERALSTVSEALAIPQWLYTAAVPVGAVLLIVRVLQAARREIDQA